MTDLLAIHWESSRLSVLETTAGIPLKVTNAFELQVPSKNVSTWLLDELRRRGISARKAVVSIPREVTTIRHLELPDAPEDEIPILISFQAANRIGTSGEQSTYDYLPLPRREGSSQNEFLLANVPALTIENIRSVLSEAMVDLVSVSLDSLALGELVIHRELNLAHSTNDRSLAICLTADHLDCVLIGFQQPLASNFVRTRLAPDGHLVIPHAIAGISRILMAAESWLIGGRIDRIWILGDTNRCNQLESALHDRWNCPVHSFDLASSQLVSSKTSSGLVDLHGCERLLGLALSHYARKTPQFDLIHPHQPRPKRDPRKLQLAVGSAAALLIVALGAAYIQST
ncbi:MAG: hypothetical protein FJ267_04945, partial [Planctomycetes bacterium]|nr:hypothetical protein [Planctomycetota bacterium]